MTGSLNLSRVQGFVTTTVPEFFQVTVPSKLRWIREVVQHEFRHATPAQKLITAVALCALALVILVGVTLRNRNMSQTPNANSSQGTQDGHNNSRVGGSGGSNNGTASRQTGGRDSFNFDRGDLGDLSKPFGVSGQKTENGGDGNSTKTNLDGQGPGLGRKDENTSALPHSGGDTDHSLRHLDVGHRGPDSQTADQHAVMRPLLHSTPSPSAVSTSFAATTDSQPITQGTNGYLIGRHSYAELRAISGKSEEDRKALEKARLGTHSQRTPSSPSSQAPLPRSTSTSSTSQYLTPSYPPAHPAASYPYLPQSPTAYPMPPLYSQQSPSAYPPSAYGVPGSPGGVPPSVGPNYYRHPGTGQPFYGQTSWPYVQQGGYPVR